MTPPEDPSRPAADARLGVGADVCDSVTVALPDLRRAAPPELTRVVERLFVSPATAIDGPYDLLDDGRTIVSGALYEYEVETRSTAAPARRIIRIFTRLGRFGGDLWEQEVRVLLGVSAVRHDSLPVVFGGGYVEADDLAYVVTDAADGPLTPEAIDGLRGDPRAAFVAFRSLVGAVALLHANRAVHRNIWPGTIERVNDGALRLARFEMSMLVGNLLRAPFADQRELVEAARIHLLNQGSWAHAYCPPERVGYLVPDAGGDAFEFDRSDVFALGVLAFELFVEPLGARLDDAPSGGSALAAWLAELRRELRAKLRRSGLPTVLVLLLDEMLRDAPIQRPSAGEVAERLDEGYSALVAVWEPQAEEEPPLLAFMPEYCRPLRDLERITHDPTEEIGALELAAYILGDVDAGRAVLLYSHTGATRYAPGLKDLAEAEGARYVLLGREMAWFCAPYRLSAENRRESPSDHILVIKHFVPRGRARALETVRPRVPLSAVDVISTSALRTASQVERRTRGRPAWRPILDAVVHEPQQTAWEEVVERATAWVLEFEDVERQQREYAYVRESVPGAQVARLRWDEERDRQRFRRRQSSLYTLTARERLSFGDFLESVEPSEDRRTSLDFYADDGAGRAARLRRGRVVQSTKLDDVTVEIRTDGTQVPDRGWIRPSDDIGTEVAIRRQRNARVDLLSARSLLSYLDRPLTIKGLRRRFARAGSGLAGGADRVVKDMLVSQPFYALHGPPGTGKTEVLAHAIRAFLESERTARILVSAQSNYALDNLAQRVLQSYDPRSTRNVVALRVVGGHGSEGRVDPSLKPWLLEPLTVLHLGRIAAHCRGVRPRNAAAADVVARWLDVLDGTTYELQERLRRGANIVFATCVTATRDNLDLGWGGGFDWVIVEEAAKAWLTELAIPLTRGARWTLVGDHYQLPAYRREQVSRLLVDAASSVDLDLASEGRRRGDYERVFNAFGQLFEHETPAVAGTEQPLARLTTQFRMRPAIANVVSRAFYKDEPLLTHPSADVPSPVDAPSWLAGPAVVWVDTEGYPGCRDDPNWSNEGEADLVARVVAELRPRPELQDGKAPLAVLSPWRQQVAQLKLRLVGQSLESCVHTVDSFQGREADIVVASLVRHIVRREGAPVVNLGHAIFPERINVMLSRARGLLVLVGRFDHFVSSGVQFWSDICEAVTAEGVVVRALDVLPPD
jgi:AAA domain